ncbi:hypothetical protein PSE_4643 [Pseudovibrio sp. FO-BEG1]|nr:hypothetical protein PSE_4643 [Pseudovibrio sp. FO-BEG1]
MCSSTIVLDQQYTHVNPLVLPFLGSRAGPKTQTVAKEYYKPDSIE